MVYFDYVLVTGSTEDEHLQTLDRVLESLVQVRFRLKEHNCKFLHDEVDYLGHRINAEGIHHSAGVLSAVCAAPAPTNITTVRSHLAMVNHYGRFLPNLATMLAPMYQLPKKDVKWHRSKDQQHALNKTKEMLSSLRVATHVDSSKPLKAAESLSALILDVKFGLGALYKQPDEARELATSLASLSEGMGIRTTALLTNMDNVIGRTVGNALEVAEALECLRGVGPNTLKELVTELGGHLLVNAQQAADVEEGRKRIADSLDNGEAMKKFATMLTAQGVAPDTVAKLTTSQEEAIAVLPRANFTRHLNCAKTGYVTAIDASVCALVSARLGAGRMKASDVVDPAVGLQLYVDVGSHLRQGDRWLTVHYNKEPLPDDYVTRLQGALSIDTKEPQHTSLVYAAITGK
ncbi:Thymidine phosphorylase [Lamellibrachia satsuma]|nr:Thymidine phosphorylase [Lamellibrachia satsuma]